ncbi:EamA family transporter RarD [Vallicoccus soli]|uniref:EamA family transporter RarD n=1 Tax=Vallicoccus soli TaxID=2339232 RepID=A0A3A3YPY1_9ACTN|nr:EamA family transporter RarD [Vallicoccus soli]
MWGLFPLYWPLLEPSGSVEVLAHRIVWSLLVVVVLLGARRRWGWLRELGWRRTGLLAAAALVIAVNWGTYIHGVTTDHVVETSLGYFINPLVTVLLGVLVLGERLRRAQWVAVAVAAVAVVVLTVDYGRPPWIALTLACSFGAYGLLKKKASVGALESLTVETLVLLPVAAGYLVVLAAAGDGTFLAEGPLHAGLLVASGVVTAVPLLAFGAAAIRVPLSVLGLLQYLAPVIQFLIGVVLFHEAMPASRWAGFALVWLALVMLTADALRHGRSTRRAAATARVAVG